MIFGTPSDTYKHCGKHIAPYRYNLVNFVNKVTICYTRQQLNYLPLHTSMI